MIGTKKIAYQEFEKLCISAIKIIQKVYSRLVTHIKSSFCKTSEFPPWGAHTKPIAALVIDELMN